MHLEKLRSSKFYLRRAYKESSYSNFIYIKKFSTNFYYIKLKYNTKYLRKTIEKDYGWNF